MAQFKVGVIKKSLAASAVSLLFLNFMFLTSAGLRWKGVPPFVYVMVNTGRFGDNAGSREEILASFRKAVFVWFKMGSSPLSMLTMANEDVSGIAGIDEIECDHDAKKAGSRSVIGMRAESGFDPDCTGESCVYIWHCENSKYVAKADVQFNSMDYSFAAGVPGGDDVSITSSAIHAIGHAVGLDHCDAGDTPQYCRDRLSSGQTITGAGSVMHHRSGDLIALSEDDILGLQSLYGVFDLPLPEEGPYSLSMLDAEIYSRNMMLINEYIKTEHDWHRVISASNSTVMDVSMSGDDLKSIVSQDLKAGYPSLFNKGRRKSAATVIAEEKSSAEIFSATLKSRVPYYSSAQLLNMRHYLTSGVLMNKLVEKNNSPSDPVPGELLDISRSSLMEMREYIIDELADRGITE